MLRSETAASTERRDRALRGLRAYQDAVRVPIRRSFRTLARVGRARLLDIGADAAARPAVVFVPSLINPPFILDLAPDNSLLRWLASNGVRPLLVDWGAPVAGEKRSITAHVEDLLLPLIATLARPPVLVGYCLGGTMALAAAATGLVHALALIAAPWRFDGYPAEARQAIAALWRAAEPACEALGVVPMEVLQAGFWRLDPARTISKYERFADLPRDGAAAQAFVALEDWANAGAPVDLAAARELFVQFYGANHPGAGKWRVGGQTVEPRRLACPTIEFVSSVDRIAPAASAAGFRNRRVVSSGHVGMVIGRHAKTELWQPLLDWLRQVATL